MPEDGHLTRPGCFWGWRFAARPRTTESSRATLSISACFGVDLATDTYPDSFEESEGKRAVCGWGCRLSRLHASLSSLSVGSRVAELRGTLLPSLR